MSSKRLHTVRILTCAICLLTACMRIEAQKADLWKFRVRFTDKAATEFSIHEPERFLSAKSLERRDRQSIEVDSTDLPVCRLYIEQLKACAHMEVLALGKWENFATVACQDSSAATRMAQLPFVKDVTCVWKGSANYGQNKTASRLTMKEESGNRHNTDAGHYGKADTQIDLCNGKRLHDEGFRGKGIAIAVIDAGFHNADSCGLTANMLGCCDVVRPASENIFAEHEHGTNVLSCMATNRPNEMVGTAPEAGYWLLRSEDLYSEQPIEQDFWAAALEYADSVGVDIVNTSLGYVVYDNNLVTLSYTDLDGASQLISRQASRAAAKGIVVVCSAGNEGDTSWKKICIPADAEHVLTVGAVDEQRKLGAFSSVGNTDDGRIKPDVVAMGVWTAMIDGDGEVTRKSGTSFAAPVLCGLTACLWQALPQYTALQLIELIRMSADRANHPDNIYGYGLPDFWKAYQMGISCKMQ